MTYKTYPTTTDVILKLDEATPLIKINTDSLWTDKMEDMDGTMYTCALTISTTTIGKTVLEISAGSTHKVAIYAGTGDETWNDWATFKDDWSKSTTKTNGYSFATSNSSGDKNWIELHIYPTATSISTTDYRPVLVFDGNIVDEL